MWLFRKKSRVTAPDQEVASSRQLPAAHKIMIAKNIIRKFLDINGLCKHIGDDLISQLDEKVEIADDEWRDAGQPATPSDLAIMYLYQASEMMRDSGHMCTHMQITRAMSDIIKNAPQDSLMPATLELPDKALSKNDKSCTVFTYRN